MPYIWAAGSIPPEAQPSRDATPALPLLQTPSMASARDTNPKHPRVISKTQVKSGDAPLDVGLKLPGFYSPHEARSVKNSNSRLVKDLADRIALHCPPAHNWQTRRRDLQESVSALPASAHITAEGTLDVACWMWHPPCSFFLPCPFST